MSRKKKRKKGGLKYRGREPETFREYVESRGYTFADVLHSDDKERIWERLLAGWNTYRSKQPSTYQLGQGIRPTQAKEHAQKVNVRVVKKKKTEPSKVLTDFEVDGQPFQLRDDGKVWRKTMGVAVADVPITDKEVEMLFTKATEPKLYSWDKGYMPPIGHLVYWRNALMEATSGEAVIYFAKRTIQKSGKKRIEWAGFVPNQEATAGGWEVDDLDDMFALIDKAGYEYTGHEHLHPGQMVSCSTRDTNDWEKVPGLYVTAPRKINKFGTWVSIGGQVFSTGQHDGGEPVKAPIFGQGKKKLKDLIKAPKHGVAGRTAQTAAGDYSYEIWDDETNKWITVKGTDRELLAKYGGVRTAAYASDGFSGRLVMIQLEQADLIRSNTGTILITGPNYLSGLACLDESTRDSLADLIFNDTLDEKILNLDPRTLF